MIRKQLHILYSSKEVKEILTPGSIVSFGEARKFGRIERPVESFKCNGKRCQVFLNVTKTERFSSTVTKKVYIINDTFNCNDKCLIYLLTFKKCMLQYVGKTVDEFRLRWNN